MNRKSILISIIFILIITISCKKNQTVDKSKKETAIDFKTDSITPFYEVVSEKGTKITLWTKKDYYTSNDKDFIIASKEISLNNQKATVKTDTLLYNEYTFTEVFNESFTQQKIDNEEFLLFSLKETFKGRAVIDRDINFYLLNINTLDFLTLTYTGKSSLRCNTCIDGDFQENKKLDQYPTLKDVLYKYASKSKHIYIASKEEKDISYYKNYIQKWYKDNNVNNDFGAGHASIPDIIYSTYYKENIFEFTGDYGTDFIENSRFKIVNYFRGNLLGYDKVKKLYFPVLVESCNYDCGKEIHFSEGNIINIQYEWTDDVSYQINLDNIQFLND